MDKNRPDLTEILSYTGFRQMQPCFVLRPYIQRYWQIKSDIPLDAPATELMHPDGGLGMIINFGSVLAYEGDNIHAAGFMDGIHTRTRQLTMTGCVDAIGIRFHPGGARRFFSMPLAEINNSTLNLSELAMEQFIESCQEERAVNPSGNILRFADGLLSGMLNAPRHSDLLVQTVMDRIRHAAGDLVISDAIHDIGKSYRQIERLFKGYVGMTPKNYARIVRVENARLRLKNNPGSSCTRIGMASGFYDQAHFIREFNSIIGLSPMQYRSFKMRTPHH